MNIKNRTWAEISLENIEKNFLNIKNYANSKILCIVKADAYGHGMIEISKVLENLGADYFGVSTFFEAINLRISGTKIPILLLGFFEYSEILELIENDITMTVFDFETAENISKISKKNNLTAKIHIKIDTGMSRLGFKFDDDFINLVRKIHSLENIFIEGIFTHFAGADDEIFTDFTTKQARDFKNIVENLKSIDIDIPLVHASASAGMLYHKDFNFDMVRTGIILYGYYPNNLCKPIEISPVMSVFSKIIQVKSLKKGEHVSYSLNFTAKEDMKIAVVAIGYADGYFRLNSNCGYFLYKGQKVNIIGNICMDMCIIDVTNIENIKKGDDILVFGANSGQTLGADVVASFANTIPYEILCSISSRVCKIY